MPGVRDEDKAGDGHVFVEISGIPDRGPLILLTTQDKGRKFDLGEPAPKIKVITSLKIAKYHRGRALSGQVDEALP